MKRSTFSKCIIMALVLMMCGVGIVSAAGETETVYPSKTVTIVVGFAPGGVGDLTARVVAQELSTQMGKQFIIENRPGAGGIVAAETVAKSTPDGYTLFLMSNGNTVSESLYKTMPYNLVRDFAMVSTLGFFDLAVVTNAESPFTTLQDLISHVKQNPGKVNIGTINVGSTQNLAAELLLSSAGLDAVIVPYKGSPDVIVALRGNDILFSVDMLAPLVAQQKAGTIRILATTGSKRFEATPDIPTVAESGVPGFEASSWNGITAPKGTPQEIIDKLNAEIKIALAKPAVQSKLLELGITAEWCSPADMKTFVEGDVKKWGDVIQAAGIPRQ